jgi:hypothetical protein
MESLDTICKDTVLTLDICAFLDNGNIQEEIFVGGSDFLKEEFNYGLFSDPWVCGLPY